MRHYRAKLQTTKQTLTTSKHSIEFTYSDFPCHLRVSGDELALINQQWKCKKSKRLRINANSFQKKDQHDRIPPLWWVGWENSGTNQIAGLV